MLLCIYIYIHLYIKTIYYIKCSTLDLHYIYIYMYTSFTYSDFSF